jgi:hypothetical protein
MGNARRSISLLVVLGLAAAVLIIAPRAGADQVGSMAAAQDGYVASTAARTTYDTAELRARNVSAQRIQSYLKFDLPSVSDKLVPREGAWWGSYPGQAAGNVEAREAVYGRQVDVLHRYHDWDDAWPTAEEQAYAAQGRLLFEGWENRIFGGATVCWADIAAGGHDAAIDAQAQRLAAFGSRLFVGFMHEPEDNIGTCQPGAVNDPVADMGSVEEFKAAYRHIVERVRPVAPNVVWVLGLMGGNPDLSWTFYPGDDVVDWVAWDPLQLGQLRGPGQRPLAERPAGRPGHVRPPGRRRQHQAPHARGVRRQRRPGPGQQGAVVPGPPDDPADRHAEAQGAGLLRPVGHPGPRRPLRLDRRQLTAGPGRLRRRRRRSLPQPAPRPASAEAAEAEVDLQVGDRVDDA